ncbi:MAG: DUF420 domain-containing protein [Deltaproteobacteria bacterium]|nr:DUF420 domain-containing protein [Deltaproteobacteria bacterium]
MQQIPWLATVNALFNLTSATLVFLGWRAIRAGEPRRHRGYMIGALCASACFLTGYLIRVSTQGTQTFSGSGALKAVYLVILFSHMLLAMVIVPMVLRTVYLAWRDRRPQHRRLARITLPLWLYVSVTGVVVYLMLYWVG